MERLLKHVFMAPRSARQRRSCGPQTPRRARPHPSATSNTHPPHLPDRMPFVTLRSPAKHTHTHTHSAKTRRQLSKRVKRRGGVQFTDPTPKFRFRRDAFEILAVKVCKFLRGGWLRLVKAAETRTERGALQTRRWLQERLTRCALTRRRASSARRRGRRHPVEADKIKAPKRQLLLFWGI